MIEIAVPTEDLFYCTPEYARMYALEALFVSKSRDESFYDVYFGLVSHHLGYWIDDHGEGGDEKTRVELLQVLRKSECWRAFLDREENNPTRILRDEVIPLGCVLHQMFSGSTKERAMEEAKEMLLYSHSDPEKVRALPKSARHLSKKTLERLWQKYSEVFHYVWLSTANQVRNVAGLEQIAYSQGKECWGQVVSAFDAVSPTKKIRVPEPVFLDFVTNQEFKDNHSEIPPYR